MPIFGVERGGRVIEWSAMMAAMTGFTKAEVQGEDLFGLVVAEHRGAAREIFARAMTGDGASDDELRHVFRFTSKAGAPEVRVQATIVTRRVDGQAIDVTCFWKDMPEARKEAALLDSIFETMALVTSSRLYWGWLSLSTDASASRPLARPFAMVPPPAPTFPPPFAP